MGQITRYYRLKQLMRNQWLCRSDLHKIQNAKLRKLLHHAYAHVPYYRHLLDSAGITPDTVQSLSDLKRIPVTTKAMLRAQSPDQIVAKNIDMNSCVKDRTSGSNGMPLNFFISRDDADIRALLEVRMLGSAGYRSKDLTLAIIDARHCRKRQWFQRFGIYRRDYMSILCPEEEQIETICSKKPDIIRALTSNLVLIASRMQREGITPPRPKAIFTMGELLDRKRRELIRTVFGASPVDDYSSTECGGIAWECSGGNGYHINADTLIVECVNEGLEVEPGESGELVITNLHSYAMPFIRYSVGDRGVLSADECSCGRGLPLLGAIEGRDVDFIVLADGRRVSPYLLTCAIEDIPGILRYQIVQETNREITVYFIKGEGYDADTAPAIESNCRDVLGEDVAVSARIADELSLDKSGKFSVVISKVSNRIPGTTTSLHKPFIYGPD